MALEIEAKLKVERFAPLRDRLLQRGAIRIGAIREENLFFEQRSGGRLRLRLLGSRGSAKPAPVLTFKGPKHQGPFKRREEIELAVGDAATVQRMLQAIGYRFILSYEKRRETWKLGGCRIELDEVPFLGRFVEVEGPSEKRVRRVLKLLGLSDGRMVHHGYYALLTRHLRKSGLRLETVRFDDARRLAG